MDKKSKIAIVYRAFDSATLNTWASIGIRTLNIFILIPFILKKFSAPEITLWYLFSTIMSFNLVFDMGFSSTFIRAIAYGMGGADSLESKHASGEPNIKFLTETWKSIRFVYFLLSIFVLVILLILGSWVVYKPIMLLNNEREGFMSWYCVLFGTFLVFFGNIYSIFLQGSNKIAIFRRFEAIFTLGSIVSSIISIYLGFGFLVLIIISQFWNIFSVLRNGWLCNKDSIYKKINVKFTIKVDNVLIKAIWGSSWRSAIGVLMSYGIINGTTVFFAQSNSSVNSASYLFSLRILQVILSFSMAPFYSKIPQLSKFYIVGDEFQLIAVAKKGMKYSHYTFTLLSIFIGLIAPIFLTAIKSNVDFINAKVWSLLILAYYIERYGAMHIQLYSVTNIIIWHIANSVTGVILFILLYFFIPKFGLYAFPVSMIISYLSFYSWYSASKSYSQFKINVIDFEKSISLPSLILILLYIGYSFVF